MDRVGQDDNRRILKSQWYCPGTLAGMRIFQYRQVWIVNVLIVSVSIIHCRVDEFSGNSYSLTPLKHTREFRPDLTKPFGGPVVTLRIVKRRTPVVS